MKVAASFLTWVYWMLLWSILKRQSFYWNSSWVALCLTILWSRGRGIYQRWRFVWFRVGGSWRLVLLHFYWLLSFKVLLIGIVTVKSILELSHFLDDGFVTVAVEGRDCGEEDVEDDASRPNIAVLIIWASNNFRSDVVRLCQPRITVPTNFFSPFAASYARMLSFHL